MPEKKTWSRGAKADWKAVEREYIYANPKKPYPVLAKELGVKPETVSHHGRKGGWVEKRAAIQDRLTDKQFENQLTEQIVGELDLIDSASMSAKILIDTILKISIRVLSQGFSDDINSINSAKILDVLSTLTNSLDRILKTLSLLQGGPTENLTNYNLVELLSREKPQ